MPATTTTTITTTTTVDLRLTPQGLINKDNNYIIQQEGIYDLLKYSWTGVLLPVTEEQYQTRVQISGDVADKYADQTKRLLQAYATVSSVLFPSQYYG